MASSTAMDATFAIKAAIRAALLADATLNAALQGLKIVDDAPSSHPTPYISFAVRSDDWSTATEDGQVVNIDLNVWHQPSTQTPETGTVRDLMGRVRTLLHTASLTLDAPFHCVQIRAGEMVGPYRDPDGATLHGVVTVRSLIDHA